MLNALREKKSGEQVKEANDALQQVEMAKLQCRLCVFYVIIFILVHVFFYEYIFVNYFFSRFYIKSFFSLF